MYNKWFFIEKPTWNNEFSFDKRTNKKLYVPNIVGLKIDELDKIKLQDDKEKIAFEDFDFDWKLQTCYWLKNFYKIDLKDKEIIIVDNHNHAFYFWYEAYVNWKIWKNSILYHIDEHSDFKDDKKYLQKQDEKNLQKIFEFTNFSLNVGNYIIPACENWLIWEVVQIRNETNLEEFRIENWKLSENIILNLDLDFFEPNLDYIDYDLKKKVILDIAQKAKLITISTSPFFINQELALEVLKNILKSL